MLWVALQVFRICEQERTSEQIVHWNQAEGFADRCPAAPKDGNLYDNEVLYWAGYVYRYWHFLTGESSKDIYKQAPAETMNTNYLMFHCMDTELAIEDLKEIHRQKAKKRSKSGRKAMPDRIQSD